jgi:hypothetical protein
MKWLTQVRRYTCQEEGGRGPMRSMCTWPNRASGVANVERGAAK